MTTDIDIDWLLRVTADASELARSYFGRTRGTLKADQSWVTEADLAVEAMVRDAIEKVRPDDIIVGEEGDKLAQRDDRYVWAIDPIDGTRVFNHGLPVWGVSIGLLVDGEPRVGAFSLPALGDVYHADGENAYLNGEKLEPPEPVINTNALLLISEGAYKNQRIDYPGKVISLGSAAAHICYVARGSAVGALDHAGLWDYAGAGALLNALGMPLRLVSGGKIDYPSLYSGAPVPEPTLAAPAHLFDEISAAFNPA